MWAESAADRPGEHGPDAAPPTPDIGTITPLPNQQGETYVVHPGEIRRFESAPPSWYVPGGKFPGPFEDDHYGQHRGVVAELMKVDGLGNPLWEESYPVACSPESDTVVSLQIPTSFECGTEYKVRFYNGRTSYWGYLSGGHLKVEPLPP
jgi:hypothetical protein